MHGMEELLEFSFIPQLTRDVGHLKNNSRSTESVFQTFEGTVYTFRNSKLGVNL